MTRRTRRKSMRPTVVAARHSEELTPATWVNTMAPRPTAPMSITPGLTTGTQRAITAKPETNLTSGLCACLGRVDSDPISNRTTTEQTVWNMKNIDQCLSFSGWGSKLFLTSLVCVYGLTAYGQGTVFFNNIGAPGAITNSLTGQRAETGSTFIV